MKTIINILKAIYVIYWILLIVVLHMLYTNIINEDITQSLYDLVVIGYIIYAIIHFNNKTKQL